MSYTNETKHTLLAGSANTGSPVGLLLTLTWASTVESTYDFETKATGNYSNQVKN